MTQLKSIQAKHKAADSDRIRKAIQDIECRRMTPQVLYLLLYCHNQADAIDAAFRVSTNSQLREINR